MDVTPGQRHHRGRGRGCPDRLLRLGRKEFDVERQSPLQGGAYKCLTADGSVGVFARVSFGVLRLWGRCRSEMRNLSAFP